MKKLVILCVFFIFSCSDNKNLEQVSYSEFKQEVLADQIAEAISQPQGDVLEDDDLLEEYRLLEEQELEAAAAQTASTTASAPTVNQTTTTPGLQMPDVPTGPINGATQEEMEQLKELQAMMM